MDQCELPLGHFCHSKVSPFVVAAVVKQVDGEINEGLSCGKQISHDRRNN